MYAYCLQVVMSEKKLKLVLKNNKFQRAADVFVFFINLPSEREVAVTFSTELKEKLT